MPNYTSDEINAKVKDALNTETFIEQVKTTLLCVYELSSLIKELDTTHHELTNAAVEKVNVKFDEFVEKKTAFEKSFNELKTELENKGQKLYDDGKAALTETKEFISKENATTREQVENFAKEIASLQDKFMIHYEKFEALVETLNEDELRVLVETLDAKQTELTRLNAVLDTQRIDLQSKIDQIPEILTKLNQFNFDFVELNEKIKVLSNELLGKYTANKAKLDELEVKTQEILADLNAQNERVENARKEVETKQGEITEAIREATTQITADKNEVQTLKNQYLTEHNSRQNELTNLFNSLRTQITALKTQTEAAFTNTKNTQMAELNALTQQFTTLKNNITGEMNTIKANAASEINTLKTQAETSLNTTITQKTASFSTEIDKLLKAKIEEAKAQIKQLQTGDEVS